VAGLHLNAIASIHWAIGLQGASVSSCDDRPSWSAHSEEGFTLSAPGATISTGVWVASTRAGRTVQTLVSGSRDIISIPAAVERYYWRWSILHHGGGIAKTVNAPTGLAELFAQHALLLIALNLHTSAACASAPCLWCFLTTPCSPPAPLGSGSGCLTPTPGLSRVHVSRSGGAAAVLKKVSRTVVQGCHQAATTAPSPQADAAPPGRGLGFRRVPQAAPQPPPAQRAATPLRRGGTVHAPLLEPPPGASAWTAVEGPGQTIKHPYRTPCHNQAGSPPFQQIGGLRTIHPDGLAYLVLAHSPASLPLSLCPQLPSTAARTRGPTAALASRAIVALWRVSGRLAQRRGLSDGITPCCGLLSRKPRSMMMPSLLGDGIFSIATQLSISIPQDQPLTSGITALLRPDRKHWLQARVEEWGVLAPRVLKPFLPASLKTSPLIA
jgi:hypothetical protein